MKYLHLTSVLAVALAVGCREAPSAPGAASPDRASQAVMGAAQDLTDYVATPAGWYHLSCVHKIEDGARVDSNRVVTRRDGSRYQIPACSHPARPVSAGGVGQPGGQVQAPVNNGWIEYAWASQPSGSKYREITANWRVPAAPTGTYPAPPTVAVYYSFPGLENNYYIIQPVLQYGYNGAFGGNYWTMASWQCHSSFSTCYYSTPLSISARDSLYGSVVASNCAGGTCTWAMTTRDVTTSQQTVYTASDYDNYNWATKGAVEVYGLSTCSQYPQNGIFYSGVTVYDGNMNQVYPSWASYIQGGLSPSCSFSVGMVDNLSVDLYHNPAPAPSLTSVTTNPTPPRQYQPFSVTLSGSGFDPATAQVVYTVPPPGCYPPGCSQVIPNGGLSVKTSTQLVIPTMTFGIAGEKDFQVQNGKGGNLSGSIAITVLPLY